MLSAVVPTFNAASTLPACLERLAGADEIVVVDGGSTDSTREIARSHGAHVIQAPRGRGSQLRDGAAATGGDWLLIVHADTLLDADWREVVDEHMRTAPQCAGYFSFRLRANATAARVLERLVALRCRLLALPYGDQGLLIPRRLYDEIGGFPSIPLMEDVEIVRSIGRARIRLLLADAWTSAEKWERDGWTRRSLRNFACLALYAMGMPPERIAKLYR